MYWCVCSDVARQEIVIGCDYYDHGIIRISFHCIYCSMGSGLSRFLPFPTTSSSTHVQQNTAAVLTMTSLTLMEPCACSDTRTPTLTSSVSVTEEVGVYIQPQGLSPSAVFACDAADH